MVITSDEEFFYIQSNKDNTRYLQFNSTSGQERFAFYTSAQKKTLLLIPAKVDTKPSFTVSPNTDLTISADGGEIEFTVTPKNGAVVTAESSDTTWLTIDNTFKATVKANETAEARSATITFSAEGCDNVVVVTVSQEGKPAEGEATSYSYTFTSKQFSANGTKALGVLNWTLAGDGGYWGYDATKGQHLGSGNNPYKNLTLSTSDFKSEVNKIVLETSGGSSVNATCTITVGGTQIGDAIKITSTSTEYTFEATTALKGDIVISYSQTSSKAIYIKSIAIN
ncbi:MAG: BACON domain-containing protein [Alistipes sp.]|nr:BACON domain-containing protein [Alistipes sp.]